MQRLTLTDIDAVEAAIGVQLPHFYRELLAEIGHGQFGDREIYHPAAVRELYAQFFDDPTQLFAPFFPFGCDHHLQELWIIDVTTDRAAAIGHETVPDDWPEEQWKPCNEWRR